MIKANVRRLKVPSKLSTTVRNMVDNQMMMVKVPSKERRSFHKLVVLTSTNP